MLVGANVTGVSVGRGKQGEQWRERGMNDVDC